MKSILHTYKLSNSGRTSRKKENIASLVGVISAFIAGSCCIGPALFVIFGASFGTIGFWGSVFEPYRWLFLSIGYLSIGYSIYRLYDIKDRIKKILKRPVIVCAACNEPTWAKRFSVGITWFSFVLLIVATFYPLLLSKIFK